MTNRLIVVKDAKDWSGQPTFHPAFTYHAFGKDEVIRGYQGLCIMLTINANTFDCFVEVTFDHRDTDADDVMAMMEHSLPKGFTQDKEAFLHALEHSAAKPPGALVNSYTKDDKEFATYFAVLSEDAAAAAYLDRMQKLSLWFIEGIGCSMPFLSSFHRCYEMLKLRFVDRTNEPEYKAFRLEVKRRLHSLHMEDLEAMGSADRRKGLLATLYEALEADYDRVLGRCGLLARPE
ncbi:hypothetical protein DYB38_001874 [Aphanomyces astaci]|uniref:histone acetyltransferase n=2 Tax=Aphanomyces astaci TaxID=112090 RepID=A0A397DSR8_APHAT|nr:hypothetical protein DYB38_001874 [Aphanomyces astaci]